jgi:hypothetical protein
MPYGLPTNAEQATLRSFRKANAGHHLPAESLSRSSEFKVAGQVNGPVREWQDRQEQAEEGALM